MHSYQTDITVLAAYTVIISLLTVIITSQDVKHFHSVFLANSARKENSRGKLDGKMERRSGNVMRNTEPAAPVEFIVKGKKSVKMLPDHSCELFPCLAIGPAPLNN